MSLISGPLILCLALKENDETMLKKQKQLYLTAILKQQGKRAELAWCSLTKTQTQCGQF